MPKDRELWHEDNGQEKRSHRSSSTHHRHKHEGSCGRHLESSREHRRHSPYHRETEPRSSTHIYFRGSDNPPSVSVHTDHVTLASNLSSLVERNDGMFQKVFEDCRQILERIGKDQAANSAICHNSSSSTSDVSRHRGANQANLVAVLQSSAKKSKPSFSMMMEKHKATNLVPATHTKQRLHQSLLSHSEAKLESIDISLFCPLTHSRMVTPVRGRSCKHIHCFDGESFCNLMWEKEISKWKCPICKCSTPLSELMVDGYIMEILASVPENVKSVEFTPDGFWRIKEATSLPLLNTSSVNANNGNNTVIDLTFDTPVKVTKKNYSNSSDNSVQVIDLTLSP